jgi:NADH-quinone oxidoreductase subunit G
MSTETVTITVDGTPLEVQSGRMLLPVLLEKGYSIPHFCYHETLGVDGNCRMCMVEIAGKKRPQISCDTPIVESMEVRTQGESIEKVRRDILELELINHPVDCPICDKAGECSLQDYYMEYGLYQGKVDKAHKPHRQKHVDWGANVLHDQERCVLCQRCVRFCREVTRTDELCVAGRGDRSYITPYPGEKLHNAYAMNVVDLCPVGALTSKDFRFKQRVWFLATSPSVCHGCAKGCNISIDHARSKYHDDTIYRFRPRSNPQINGEFICDAGRLSYKEEQENLLEAPLRGDETIGEADARDALASLLETDDPIVILCDANLYTEELEHLIRYADTLGAALHAPLEAYIDKAFGDEWLRSPMRAANAEGVRQLGIDTSLPTVDDNTLVINVNHPDGAHFSRRIDLRIHRPEGGTDALLALPIAPFVQRSGHLTNEDGIEQYCEQVLRRDHPLPTLSDWLTLPDDNHDDRQEVTP